MPAGAKGYGRVPIATPNRLPMATIEVTLDCDHVRRVVTFALWRIIAVNIVGERALSDGYYDRALKQINPAYMVEPEAGPTDARLARLSAITAAAQAVESGAAGDRIALPVRRQELADALQDCVRAIDLGHDLLLALDEGGREDVARCRRTALRLLRTTASTPVPAPARQAGTGAV